MAFLDEANRAVVLRVVYAGPPLSGKTATLNALSQQMLGARGAGAVFSPEEAHGRTLFFDWMEYTAGLFKGRQIRCQIVSVPGQPALVARRRLLIGTADSVVFVVGAQRKNKEEIDTYLRELREFTRKPEDELPVGVIVQANKMDLPDALPPDALRELFEDDVNLTVVPTVATTGRGVREVFVQAVGLGLARAREMFDGGRLLPGKPDIASGQDLLQRMRAYEESEFGTVGKSVGALRSVLDRADGAREGLAASRLSAIVQEAIGDGSALNPAEAPRQPGGVVDDPAEDRRTAGGPARPQLPDRNPKAGSVWPTIAGRIIVHEISGLPVRVERRADEAWIGRAGEAWDLLSLAAHGYPEEARARDVMLAMAREHSRLKAILSEHRCIAYTESGMGDWRIWQIVRRDRTLADLLHTVLPMPDTERVATEIFRIAKVLWTAVERFGEHGIPIPATLQSVGVNRGNPVLTGFLTLGETDEEFSDVFGPVAGAGATVRGELQESLRSWATSRPGEAPRFVRQLELLKQRESEAREAAEILIAICIGH